MSGGVDPVPAAPLTPANAEATAVPWARVFYWSVRRELWEHRAIYLAPIAVAVFAVVLHFLSSVFIPDAERAGALASPARAGEFLSLYRSVNGVIVVSGILVGVLYCLGALHGERRDRSILFWKSLPVSDLTAVLSKAAVPMLVLPLIVFAAVIAANVAMITLQTIVWRLDGFDPRALWARLDLPFLWLALLYGLPFMVLWYAPFYAWLLFVSAWARRWPFLWAAAPFLAMLMVEHLALHHTGAHWLVERWFAAVVTQPYSIGGAGEVWVRRLSDLEPARLYSQPGLWLGLAVAALFIVGATRLRRSRGPV